MSIFSVDRIEGACAVLVGDAGDELTVLLTELPEGIKAGNVVRAEDGVYQLDTAEEQRRRAQILSLQEKLRRKK